MRSKNEQMKKIAKSLNRHRLLQLIRLLVRKPFAGGIMEGFNTKTDSQKVLWFYRYYSAEINLLTVTRGVTGTAN